MATNKPTRIFHVYHKCQCGAFPTHTFFSSKKSIAEYFGQHLGTTHGSLRTRRIYEEPYENRIVRITEGVLWRTSHVKEMKGGSDE